MPLTPALLPTSAQIEAAHARDDGTPIFMLNLLRFRERAAYADGRASDLSGRDAYALYGQAMLRMVMAAGGSLTFFGEVRGLLIGAADEAWDQVAVMMYPSFKVMSEITASPAYAEIHLHREAGLAEQLLVETVLPAGFR